MTALCVRRKIRRLPLSSSASTWRLHCLNSCRIHCRVFILRGSLAAADNRTGMAHPAARRRGLSGDESHHRLLYMRLDPFRRALLGVAPDFADQNDRARIRVVVEHLDAVQERSPDDRVASDADTCRLSDAKLR